MARMQVWTLTAYLCGHEAADDHWVCQRLVNKRVVRANTDL